MKIYIAHSKKMNYLEDLYNPIREDETLQNYDIILPHEHSTSSINSRNFYKELSIVIAEVSNAGTGLGIELGWAFDDGVPIYCVYKKGSKIASSLALITDKILEYESSEELIHFIKKIIINFESQKEKKD